MYVGTTAKLDSQGLRTPLAVRRASVTDVESVEVSILMPCLNEADTIVVCVRKARGYLESRGIWGEVIVADNGSTDGSQSLARAVGARVVHVSNRGYGAAL